MALAPMIAGMPVLAQNPIAELGGSTYREKAVYAVYDLPGTNRQADAIEGIVLDAIRTYARNAQVRYGIPPSPYPDNPGQMTIGQRLSGGPKPDCAGELLSVEGLDTSMAKYGEKIYHRVCLFPYTGGLRINYFALYGQQSGAGNANPNVLAAMLGRAIGGAMGLGDSSATINKLLAKLENGLQTAGIGFKLVQLHPKDLAGRTVVEDDIPRPATRAVATAQVQATTTEPAQPAQASPAQTTAMMPAPVPPAMAQLQAALLQQREMARQQMAAQLPPQGQPERKLAAAAARKELTAMGLQYFSQEQFLAAIHRGDVLAVDLFITGAGIDLNAGAPGATPLAIAESNGRQDIVALLKNSGAR
jgi:hypothetical protein